MSACPELSYTNVSPAAWLKIKAAVLADYGVEIPQDAGLQSGDGFALQWAYVDGNLSVTCVNSPWWAACSVINGRIDGLIRPLLTA
jgi:hypothetical protein